MVQQSMNVGAQIVMNAAAKTSKPDDEAKTSQQQTNKRGIETDFLDNSSVVIVYKNAVLPADNVSGKDKRDSSSSDEPLDTSDEAERLPVSNLEIREVHNIDRFISDARKHSMEAVSVVNRGECRMKLISHIVHNNRSQCQDRKDEKHSMNPRQFHS